MFEPHGGDWTLSTTVTPSLQDGSFGGLALGGGLTLDGDVALVGAATMDVVARRGNQDVHLTNSGVVYALERGASGWHEAQVLRPSDPVSRGAFGDDIAVSGDVAIIGRPMGGVDRDGPLPGAAYVFERVGGQWVESAKLEPSDGFVQDAFGAEVALSGNLAAVLAPNGATPRIYLFTKIGGAWHETGRIEGQVPFRVDQFGIGMEMDGPHLAVGARLDDEIGSWGGAVYMYAVPEPDGNLLPLAALGTCALVCRRRDGQWPRGYR